MRLISLTTDFGIKDGYDGVMKAVIYGIAPDVKIIDITHQVSPQNVLQGGLTLFKHITFFPEGTVHIIVIDPGVGTTRRPIAARIGTQFYVAPDNGVLTPMIERGRQRSWPMEFVRLDNPKFWLERISHTFHGRDIFSPVGAHLARGVSLHEVGTPIGDPVLLSLPKPRVTPHSIIGEVTTIDNFGNLRANIRQEDLLELDQTGSKRIAIAGHVIDGLVNTFGDAPPGTLVAFVHSDGSLGISVVNDSAAEKLNVTIGETIRVESTRT